jgi:excisionase family DNA binding protein
MTAAMTVRDVCERFAVSPHTVLAWIRSGDLAAVDVSPRPGGKRPRWRISPRALEAFELRRTGRPAGHRTRRTVPGGIVQFY